MPYEEATTFLGLTGPQWLGMLAMVSVVSSAVFGLLALFTNYKEDGRITRYGRLSVFGILISAICAVGTRVAQDAVDAARSAKAAEAERVRQRDEEKRFNRQLGELTGLQAQMKKSLKSQQDQLAAQRETIGKAEAALRATAALANQEQANTGLVVRSLWTEAQRVSRASIVVGVRVSCTVKSDFAAAPIWGSGTISRLEIVRVDQQVEAFLGKGANARMVGDAPEPGAMLETVHGSEKSVEQYYTFAGFSGDKRPFDLLPAWEGALLQFEVRARLPGLVDRFTAGSSEAGLRHFFDEAQQPRWWRIGSSVGERWGDYRMIVLPCTPVAYVMVNDRQVASAPGRIYEILEGPETGSVRAVFPAMRVDASMLPSLTRSNALPRRNYGYLRLGEEDWEMPRRVIGQPVWR